MKAKLTWMTAACAGFLLVAVLTTAGLKGYGTTLEQAKKPSPSPSKPPEVRKEASPPVRDPELVNLVDALHGAKAEFGCDALLKLVENGQIRDKSWRVEILEAVFRLASNAEHPFRKICALGSTDTTCGQLSGGLRLSMDVLALRSRAVILLLRDDRVKARNLFDEIPLPKPPKSECSSPWIYDTTAYYKALQAIIKSGLTPEEKSRGEAMFMLTNAIREADTAQQLQAIVTIIPEMDLSTPNLASILSAFVERMKKLDEHPRSLRIGAIGLAHFGLELANYTAKRRISNVEFLEGIRDLIASTFHDFACQAGTISRPTELPEFLTNFNEGLSKATYPEKQIPPVTLKDYTPTRFENSVEVREIWRNPASRRQLMAIKHLRFGDGHEPLKDDEKDNDSWRREASQILEDVARWQGSGDDTDAEVFIQRRMMYAALIDLVPRHHPLQDQIVDRYVSFLEDNQDVADAWLVWYLEADYLLKWGFKDRPDERKKFLERLSNSRNLTLSLLGKMEKYLAAHTVAEAVPAPVRKATPVP